MRKIELRTIVSKGVYQVKDTILKSTDLSPLKELFTHSTSIKLIGQAAIKLNKFEKITPPPLSSKLF